MHCADCDYELWNVRNRACPECGKPFLPSEFTFYPNAVEFRCPHCAQPYFGTSRRGHLEPPMFNCVGCGRPVTMDEMILAPAEGVDPEKTGPTRGNPWLQRDRLGLRRAWWRAVVMGLVKPADLARDTPPETSIWEGWKFAILNITIVGVVGLALVVVMMGLMMIIFSASGGGSGGPPVGAVLLGQGVLQVAAQFAIPVAYLAIWIVVTHGVLLSISAANAKFTVTANALLYTSGAHLLTLVPCVSNLAWVWWIVSAILATKQAHATTGTKASLAVLVFPITLLVLVVAGYAIFFYFMFSSITATPPSAPPTPMEAP